MQQLLVTACICIAAADSFARSQQLVVSTWNLQSMPEYSQHHDVISTTGVI
jgi:hypothetical protein